MPNKKVIDILPPKESVADLQEDKFEERVQIKEIPHKKTARTGKGLIFFLVLLILLGIFGYLTLSKAEIDLWPETEVLNLEKELTISKEAKQVDALSKVIPAQVFQKEKQITSVFTSSGKVLKEEKAKGILRVYNAYSTSPQVLIAITRFVSAEGKVFRTPVMVTIPGGTYDGGKLIPGEVDIEVVADQPGPDYNIGSSIFSIPGFAGTDKYTKFYGRSFEPMTGGLREERAVVTKEDFDKAEEFLSKQVEKECKELLARELQLEEISSKYYYFPNESLIEISEKLPLATVGEELEEFKFQIKASCQTLLFQKEDLRSFAKDLVVSQASQGYKLHEDSLRIDYALQTIDSESGEAVLFLNISAKTYSEVDVGGFKNALSGKSLLETKLFLESQPNITKANVRFWPFWVGKVPEDLDKIKVSINID
jgi:effector-binding domain-containing protein